jgi:hypothetical protein
MADGALVVDEPEPVVERLPEPVVDWVVVLTPTRAHAAVAGDDAAVAHTTLADHDVTAPMLDDSDAAGRRAVA